MEQIVCKSATALQVTSVPRIQENALMGLRVKKAGLVSTAKVIFVLNSQFSYFLFLLYIIITNNTHHDKRAEIHFVLHYFLRLSKQEAKTQQEPGGKVF